MKKKEKMPPPLPAETAFLGSIINVGVAASTFIFLQKKLSINAISNIIK